MKQLIFLIVCTVLLSAGCSSAPRQELHKTQKTVAKALAAGAPDLAATEYASANSALQDAETLIKKRKYKLASEALALSRAHARRALALCQEETVQKEELISSEKINPKPRKDKKKSRKSEKVEPLPQREPKEMVRPSSVTRYIVGNDETLWIIAARKDIYGDPLLWPLLYRANRDQIKDPRHIFIGQILDVPRNFSAAERTDALERAQSSDIFPVDILFRHRSTRP
jgi:nucleoid-associated protein YgaU